MRTINNEKEILNFFKGNWNNKNDSIFDLSFMRSSSRKDKIKETQSLNVVSKICDGTIYPTIRDN